MLSGLVQSDRPFFRTPKQAERHRLGQALAAAREEAFLMFGLWFAAFGASRIPSLDGDLPGLVGSPDLTVWVAVLLIQSIPYAAAVVVSLINAFDLRGDWIGEAGLGSAGVAHEHDAPQAPSGVEAASAAAALALGPDDERLFRRVTRADAELLLEKRS